MIKFLFTCCVLILVNLPVSAAAQVNQDLWNDLLAEHVMSSDGGQSTYVDYAGMQLDQDKLEQYLGQLSAVTRVEFEGFSDNQQLAFLINAYNAFRGPAGKTVKFSH